MNPFDFFGRFKSLTDTFGAGGVLVIAILAIIVSMIALWRGTGLILFILFLTYSVGAVTSGGVLFVATMVRWFCLILLGIGFFKRFYLPKASICFFGFYAILALILVVFSPLPVMAFQQGILLLLTVICVPIAVNNYIKSTENIRLLFKMGIIAGTVWTMVNTMFLSEFMYSSEQRFIAEGTAGTGVIAYAGAFFAPMIVWGIIQKRDKLWRIFSAILIIPFVMIMILSGVRSAIFGMLGIALFPLFFMKRNPLKSLIQLFMVFLLIAAGMSILLMVVPEKGRFLIDRIFSTSTTGRIFVWKAVLSHCIQRPFIGLGIGAAGVDGISIFGLQFHNAYLEIWYNSGIVGLLLVLVFLGIYTFRNLHLVMIAPTEELAVFSRVSLGYMLAILAMNMMEGALSTAGGISVTMVLIIAVIIDRLKEMMMEEYHNLYTDEERLSEEGLKQDRNVYSCLI